MTEGLEDIITPYTFHLFINDHTHEGVKMPVKMSPLSRVLGSVRSTSKANTASHVYNVRPRTYATVSDSIAIERTAGALGAVVHVPSVQSLSTSAVKQIHDTFLEHSVVFLRPSNPEQLQPEAFLSLAQQIGKPIEYPFVSGIDGHPQIIRVMKREHEITNFGGIWHSDTSYLATPPKATMLTAQELPPYGGDTLFANQHLAYETLSPGLKSMLSQLRGVNTSAKADTSKTREDRIKDSSPATAPSNYEASHPVVRTHPETGRKALYINTAHTSHFDGWSEKESEGLLKMLHEHQVKVEHTTRHRWRVGDVAVWDNRCVLHNPINDYQGYRRSVSLCVLCSSVSICFEQARRRDMSVSSILSRYEAVAPCFGRLAPVFDVPRQDSGCHPFLILLSLFLLD